ncbi:MAG: UxaA family hydrolase, partial [Deltaproteobacteria bacterium]|nr:UxaA family hydrolase [Deltaproteobacteria bacterium]
EHHVSKLVLGLKCGGSDATSGLAANPALGAAADLLIGEGGAAVMIEPLEAVGAEEELANRAANETVRRRILRMVSNEEKRWTVPGMQVEFMCKGNVDGGLSTIEEKALGAVHKGGTKPIQGVLRNDEEVLEKVPGPGFYLQDGTHLEPMALSYLVAAGAQIVVFTSGRGGTFGHAVVPVLKVCGNPETFAFLRDDLDIDAGTIMKGRESIESVGRRIFLEALEVASGKLTKAEELGYDNFSVYRKDPRLDALLGIPLK